MMITTQIAAEKSDTTACPLKGAPTFHGPGSSDFLVVMAALLAQQNAETTSSDDTAKGETETKSPAGRSEEKEHNVKRAYAKGAAAQIGAVESAGSLIVFVGAGVNEASPQPGAKPEPNGGMVSSCIASSQSTSAEIAPRVTSAEQSIAVAVSEIANECCGLGHAGDDTEGETSLCSPAIVATSDSMSVARAQSQLQSRHPQLPVPQGSSAKLGDDSATARSVDVTGDGCILSVLPPQWRDKVENVLIQKTTLLHSGASAGQALTSTSPIDRVDTVAGTEQSVVGPQRTSVPQPALNSQAVLQKNVETGALVANAQTALSNESARSASRERTIEGLHAARYVSGEMKVEHEQRSESKVADQPSTVNRNLLSAATSKQVQDGSVNLSAKGGQRTATPQLSLIDDKPGVNRPTRSNESQSENRSSRQNETSVELPGLDEPKIRLDGKADAQPTTPSGPVDDLTRVDSTLRRDHSCDMSELRTVDSSPREPVPPSRVGTQIDVAQNVRQLADAAAAQASSAAPSRTLNVINQDGRTDVHISIRTPEMGRLELHANAAQEHIAAAITVESLDLRKSLLADLGSLQHALAERRVEAPQITIAHSQGGAGVGAGNGDSQHRQQHGFTPPFQQRQATPEESVSCAEQEDVVVERMGLDINV
jgi:hypothetical protein